MIYDDVITITYFYANLSDIDKMIEKSKSCCHVTSSPLFKQLRELVDDHTRARCHANCQLDKWVKVKRFTEK